MLKTSAESILKHVNSETSLTGNLRDTAPPLVIRFGAIGDMILTTPLLRALAERHGQPCEVVGRGTYVAEIFANLPFVWSIRSIESNKTPYLFNQPKKMLVNWLQQRSRSPVYLVQSDLLSHMTLKRAGITAEASDLTVERRINEHVVDHMARLGGFVDAAGNIDPNYNRGTELRVSREETEHLSRWMDRLRFAGRDIVVIQPGFRKCMSKRRRLHKGKFWPEIRWIRLIREILNIAYDKRIILIGSMAEKPLTSFIADQVNDHRVTDIAGQNLRPILALLNHAHSMVSLDTGPAHAAAALNCPLIVLFGKTDPRVNRPISRSSKVIILTGPPGAVIEDEEPGWARHHDITAVSVDDVLAAWTDNLL